MKQGSSTESFLREIMVYRPILMRALAGILGEMGAKSVFRRLLDMEASGAFIEDPKPMEELGAFFVGDPEDLGFYVLTVLDEGVQKYFVPWLHEFGHFLCYCLQERPMMAAMGMLTSALKDRGYPMGTLRDLDQTREREKESPVWELVRALAQLSVLNEAMAVWWEDRLLIGMEFEPGGYLDAKRANNPYVAKLEAGGEKTCLDYIRNWHELRYYREPFARTFLESFGKIKVDRWLFLEEASRKGAEG